MSIAEPKQDGRSDHADVAGYGAVAQAVRSATAGSLPPSYEADRGRVSAYLRRFVGEFDGEVYALCAYHLGWADAEGRPANQVTGKMLRPTLCLSACRAFADADAALGIAASIELLHAFSLVHDDIEDSDRERHGRPTLWTLTGVPLALNAGDCLFALANRAFFEAAVAFGEGRSLVALRLFSDAYLRMIEGQHLDIEYERRPAITTDDYVRMVRGKTGALLGASLALGALCGGAAEADVRQLNAAGVELGLAFQAVDDMLAIWGDPAQTGKAVGNDLARGKKSLPVTLAIERGWVPDGVASRSLDEFRARLEALRVPEAAHAFAAEHAAVARRLVDGVQISTHGRQELAAIFDFVVSRTR
ncbi:MAG TPA: polyprenyl synthetase family protein [Dehalococcoidia bacterium]|nr:polyprenyl synthetase family protein [Dehalococcoidia bacterium]